MGLDLTIRLTPYLKIHNIKSKFIEVPKVKRVCPKHENFKARDEKFCPYCGTEIVNHEYSERQELRPHSIFNVAGLEEDHLFTTEYLDGVLKPNHRPPHHINIEEQSNGAVDLHNSQQIMHEQMSWFKSKYKHYIAALVDAYGEENVEVCWGLLHYWH